MHKAAGRRAVAGHQLARRVLPDDPKERRSSRVHPRMRGAERQRPLQEEAEGRRAPQVLLSRRGRVRRGE